MHSQQSTFAVLVSASTFELLNSSGLVVLLAGSFGPNQYPAVYLDHNDPLYSDSLATWTTSDGVLSLTQHLVALIGSSRLADGASRQPATVQVQSSTGAGQPYGASVTSGTEEAFSKPQATLNLYSDGTNRFVDAVAPTIGDVTFRARMLLVSNGYAALQSTGGAEITRVSSAGAQAGGRVVVDNTGAYVQGGISTGNVHLQPGSAASVQVNNKIAGLALQDGANPTLAANRSIGYRSFIGPQATITCAAGDLVWVTLNTRTLCTVAGGAQITELQVNGPGGAFITTQRLVGTQWAVNHDASQSVSFYILCTLGSGTYVFSMVGGQTGGTWIYIAPDTWLSLIHFAVR